MGKLDDPVADASLESRLISLIFEVVRNITANKDMNLDEVENSYKQRVIDRLYREEDYYGSLFYVVAVLAIFCVIFSVLMCLMYHYNKDEKDQNEGKNFIKEFWVSRNVTDDLRRSSDRRRRSTRKRLFPVLLRSPSQPDRERDRPAASSPRQHQPLLQHQHEVL